MLEPEARAVRPGAVRTTRVRVRYADTDRMGVVYYEVTGAADAMLSAAGHTVHAAVDASGKPCRLLARVREMLG